MNYKFKIGDIVYSSEDSLSQRVFIIFDRRSFSGHAQYYTCSSWIDEKYFMTKEEYIKTLSKFSIGQDVIVSLSVTRNTNCERTKQMEGVKYQVQNIDVNAIGDIYCFIGELWLKQDELEEYIDFKNVTNKEVLDILEGL